MTQATASTGPRELSAAGEAALPPPGGFDPGIGEIPVPEAPAAGGTQRFTALASAGAPDRGPQLTRATAAAERPVGTVASRQERPALRLLSAHEQPGSTATIARAEARRQPTVAEPAGSRRAQTSGARLAAATGAALSQGDEGYETVVFPQPAGLAFAPAVSLMRAGDGAPEPAPQPSASNGPAAQAAPAPAPTPTQGGGGGGGDIEEIYTQVIERLRRDLLADRERMGDLLGDLP